ncbi:MAG: hypothetical protein CSA97_04030 [Bacteroidetes bacterium]|nr:MAG: hypothetical protein CSA97_04030 [Bacteroidota bacterium]
MRRLYSLLLLGVLALASCGGSGDQGATSAGDSADSNLAIAGDSLNGSQDAAALTAEPTTTPSTLIAYVKEAKLYILESESGRHTLLASEQEPVFNCTFSISGFTLFYTVVRDEHLILKRALLEKGSVQQIEEICDMGVSPEQCKAQATGAPSEMFISTYGDVVLPYGFSMDFVNFVKLKKCDPTDGTLSTIEGDERHEVQPYGMMPTRIPTEDLAEEEDELYQNAAHQLIYKGIPVSSELGLKTEDLEALQLTFWYPSLSPDGKKLLFGAVTSIGDLGHGPFCIADIDGQNQRIIGSDISAPIRPKWGHNNELVYAEQGEDGAKLLLRKPDYNAIAELASGMSYWCVW